MAIEFNSVSSVLADAGTSVLPNADTLTGAAARTPARLPSEQKTPYAQGVVGVDSGLSGRLIKHDAAIEAATQHQAADKTLQQAGDLLGQVGGALGNIVKMYPPYPHDHPERINLLNQLTGLRKQLEALTFSPVIPQGQQQVQGVLKQPEWGAIEQSPQSVADNALKGLAQTTSDAAAQLGLERAHMWQDVVPTGTAGDPASAAKLSERTSMDLATLPLAISQSGPFLKTIA
jgi:hypothetical protein